MRSEKTYLQEYFERLPKERLSKLAKKRNKSATIDLNALFGKMSLSDSEMEKTLRELGASFKFKIKSPIVAPTIIVEDFAIDVEFLCEVQNHAFSGEVDERPFAHLMNFDTLCGTFKKKDVT